MHNQWFKGSHYVIHFKNVFLQGQAGSPQDVLQVCFCRLRRLTLSLSCAELTVCSESVLRLSFEGFLLFHLDGDFTITSKLSSFSSVLLVSVGEGQVLPAGLLTESLLDDFPLENFLNMSQSFLFCVTPFGLLKLSLGDSEGRRLSRSIL